MCFRILPLGRNSDVEHNEVFSEVCCFGAMSHGRVVLLGSVLLWYCRLDR
jgi:hypothetical protein